MQYILISKYCYGLECFLNERVDMKHTNSTPRPDIRTTDVAILFLRFFIGVVSLLHIIGKLQTYDNTILVYPQILGLDPATSFAVATIIDGVLTAMIVLGVGTRFAAAMMCIISVLVVIYSFMQGTMSADMRLNFVYMGIYITLLISGGGYYSYRVPDLSKKYPK